jgi:hypothetical protein
MVACMSRALEFPLTRCVIAFQQGASPEKIVESFSTVKLSQVYGAIACYLENEKAVNDYLEEGRRAFESAQASSMGCEPVSRLSVSST